MTDFENTLALNPPLVSIALCTYNGERFLRPQLDSLLAQTHRPLEILVTDDNSTDSTWSILQEYAEKSELFKIEQNSQNLGYVKNFEKTLERCNGSYIGFCDQDDIWLPDKVSTQLTEIGDYSLVYSTPAYIDEQGDAISMPPFKVNRLSGRCPLALLFHTCVTGHLALIQKDVLKYALPFPAGIKAHDKWVPFVAAAMSGIKATDSVVSLYRIHSNNVSRNKRKAKEQNIIKKIVKRRHLVHERLKERLEELESAQTCELLSETEKRILEQVVAETQALKHAFINQKLKKLLLTHQDTLLPLYKKPKKIAARLSRGLFYYATLLYLNRA